MDQCLVELNKERLSYRSDAFLHGLQNERIVQLQQSVEYFPTVILRHEAFIIKLS